MRPLTAAEIAAIRVPAPQFCTEPPNWNLLARQKWELLLQRGYSEYHPDVEWLAKAQYKERWCCCDIRALEGKE